MNSYKNSLLVRLPIVILKFEESLINLNIKEEDRAKTEELIMSAQILQTFLEGKDTMTLEEIKNVKAVVIKLESHMKHLIFNKRVE
jgi:hypothetical protein